VNDLVSSFLYWFKGLVWFGLMYWFKGLVWFNLVWTTGYDIRSAFYLGQEKVLDVLSMMQGMDSMKRQVKYRYYNILHYLIVSEQI
jgi:hypothetical protein